MEGDDRIFHPVKVGAFLGWLWIAALVVGLATRALSIDPAWYTNNYGDNRTYTIARFSGQPDDRNPAIVVSPDPATFAAKHVAWPSAVVVGDRVYLYAAGHDGTSWQGIGLWTSSDGRDFAFEGRVLAPEEDEHEIRMAHVLRDGERFRMWYSAVVEAGALPTEVRYAESTDGQRWDRGETILSSGAAYDAAGLVPDWVCRDEAQWHLFYTAYDSHERSVAALAVGAAPDRKFERQGVVLRNDGVGAALVSRGTPGFDRSRVGDQRWLSCRRCVRLQSK